jgi:hypothetical protein
VHPSVVSLCFQGEATFQQLKKRSEGYFRVRA